MTYEEIALLILTIMTIVMLLYIILLRKDIKVCKKELELKKDYIDPCHSPIVIKMKCIDRQLENMGKKSR